MEKNFTLSLLLTFALSVAYSYSVVDPCPGDILLSSQAAVDSFTCAEVTGSLTISGEDITNLNALSDLQKVNGDLNIEVNVNLKTLEGLSSLTFVGGSLSIRYDTVLQNLDGLESLTHAGGLYIFDNYNLESLNGLASLHDVSGPLSIQYNSRLSSLDAFPALVSVTGEIRLANNENLTSIDGFGGLTKTAAVAIVNNLQLLNINGFNSLTSITDDQGNAGDLLIEANNSLVNLQGFSALATVNYFTVTNNLQLSDVAQFSLLRTIAGGMYITDNPQLSNINGLAHVDSVGGELRIQNNDKLNDLDAFTSLKRVGSISIYENQNLTNIDGLSNVYKIGEGFGSSIWISNNDALTHVDGFTSLTSIAGPILIKHNPALVTIQGFPSLTMLNGHIEISNNNQLTSLNGFKALSKISNSMFGSGIIVNLNPLLSKIDGFSALQAIEGSAFVFLEIGDNRDLTNINGFSNLTSIVGGGRGVSISIYRNPALENIIGLSSLSELDVGYSGSLLIDDNEVLTNIDGLSALTGNRNDPPLYITVTNNNALVKCDGLYPYFASLGTEEVLQRVDDGIIQISGNGAGCTVEDILANGHLSIASFAVVDARTDEVIASFHNDSVTLDVADPGFQYWAIRANTVSEKVQSVAFIFDNTTSQIKNQLPYTTTLAIHSIGSHAVTAQAFSEANGEGTKGPEKKGIITIINSAAVIELEVVNLSGQTLTRLTDGAKINLKDPGFREFSIKANTNPDVVSTVKFWVNEEFYSEENAAPYALDGDTNATYNPWRARRGLYTLRATPYIKIGTDELEGTSLAVRFEVVSSHIAGAAVSSIDIIEPSGKFLFQLKDGSEINMNDPRFKAVAIMANTEGGVSSVKFFLNNSEMPGEGRAAVDLNNHTASWFPRVGVYTLSAIPYTYLADKKTSGTPLTIRFSVVDKLINTSVAEGSNESAFPRTISLYPVPVDGELFLDMDDRIGVNSSLMIVNIQGSVVYNGVYHPFASINTTGLRPGIYFLKIIDDDGFAVTKRFVKR